MFICLCAYGTATVKEEEAMNLGEGRDMGRKGRWEK